MNNGVCLSGIRPIFQEASLTLPSAIPPTQGNYFQRLNELLKLIVSAVQEESRDKAAFRTRQHMELAPMQIYSSPLLFGPSLMVTRFNTKLSRHKTPRHNDEEKGNDDYYGENPELLDNDENGGVSLGDDSSSSSSEDDQFAYSPNMSTIYLLESSQR
ncbi:hypothetical protein N5P37_006862 [Trichoderma harzianum]|nr:hypothetical protein N5P37_006862 [Trichoderma harzianum]